MKWIIIQSWENDMLGMGVGISIRASTIYGITLDSFKLALCLTLCNVFYCIIAMVIFLIVAITVYRSRMQLEVNLK